MTDERIRRTLILFGVMAISAFTRHAAASAAAAPDIAIAQTLFDEGKREVAAGHYNEGCLKLAESQRLDPGTGTLLNLANCYEKLGKTASAWATYLEAAAAARQLGQTDRDQVARKRAADLESRLAKLVIVVSKEASSVTDLEVKRDGRVVAKATWGIPIPVDPGEHVIEASAPGYKTWQSHLAVDDAKPPVDVNVPALVAESRSSVDAAPTSAAPTEPLPGAARAPVSALPPRVDSERHAGRPFRTVGYVSLGVGATGILASAVLGVVAYSKNHSSKAHCSTYTSCDQAGYDLRQGALQSARFSTVSFVVGVIGAAAGIAFLSFEPRPQEHHSAMAGPSWTADLGISASAGNVTIRRAF